MVIVKKLMVRGLFLALAVMLVWQFSSAQAADQSRSATGHSYQNEVLARVGAIEGDAKVQRAGEAQFKKIEVNSKLYLLDFVATGKKSKLWWKGTFNAYSPSEDWKPGPDVTHGSLGADSVFGFLQFERVGASYRFVGQIRKGSVRFIKSLPPTSPPSTFTISTHTAWIEVLPSDRAADFVVQSQNESLTTVTVLWGKVRVRNASPEIKESRILTSCQEVDVEKGREPGEIKWVSTDTMKELVKRTTIPKTLPEDVPSCERLKTEQVTDLTVVYLPPPGVALFPVPVPIPVPGDKEECCPPGQTYDPRTRKCVCPCPEGQPPPSTALGANGPTTGPCNPCRSGARFNPQTCSCECPCPEGQYIMPGAGCVPQCPEGFYVDYTVSNAPPYRCPICRQGTPPPPPPPPTSCRSQDQCGPCEVCVEGSCIPRTCDRGHFLNRQTCQCEPATNGLPPTCSESTQCPPCQRCVDGSCRAAMICGGEHRLNLSTCQCEPLNGVVQTTGSTGQPTGCQNNSDCPEGQACRKGKCVKKPPPVSRPLGETDTFTQPFVEDPSVRELRQEQEGTFTGPSFGTGIGIGGGGGGGRQLVPTRPPQRVAPVQRIPKGGKPN